MGPAKKRVALAHSAAESSGGMESGRWGGARVRFELSAATRMASERVPGDGAGEHATSACSSVITSAAEGRDSGCWHQQRIMSCRTACVAVSGMGGRLPSMATLYRCVIASTPPSQMGSRLSSRTRGRVFPFNVRREGGYSLAMLEGKEGRAPEHKKQKRNDECQAPFLLAWPTDCS